ncbi:hypothetical protein I5H03_gp069 [Mycobacterium phage Nibb]|uniref:Uncharacterized protein n=1 Tax=Mycobacterium phage Nibb TaxID=2510585 RepID=A0A411B5G1_9CAUD|nr:hypothetical protein I5H03_gp069 [Mycobacterium phage Nibb]QAX95577.1 hypothetical protein SEA_NIBB_38 [Mycobacterium phage Nibb]
MSAPAEVWVLDVSIEGPEGGDYDGLRTVHLTREGAFRTLLDKLAEHGVSFGDDVETLATSAAENGSLAGDFAVDEIAVSYGVQLAQLRP